MSESYFVQDDGYCLWGSVPRWPGLYPAAVFKYRPSTPGIRRRYAETAGIERENLAKQLVSQRVDGLRPEESADLMPLKADMLDKMHADLFGHLLNHVLGYEGPDVGLMEKNSERPSG